MKQYREIAKREIEEFCYCVNLLTKHTLVHYQESSVGDNRLYACEACGVQKVIRTESELENITEVENGIDIQQA